jgi:bifunctional UDP-N-acetylglucosamine pyrophosphorylase/glucosamine-1-phosphate N-acetyltransferase
VILAAGLGTRLRPITESRSKAMVPVAGRPLVERVLQPLVANGVRDLVLVVGPKDDEIRNHFALRTDLGVSTRFVVQEDRRGMPHALGLAEPFLEDRFVLSACDSLLSAEHVGELLRAFEKADAVLSLLDVEREAVSRSAPVALDGRVVRRIVEKPRPEDSPSNTVSLPLYLLPKRLLGLFPELRASPRGELEIQDAIQLFIDRGQRVIGVRARERHQVSSPSDLLDLNRHFLRSGSEPPCVAPDRIGAGSVCRGPVRIDPGVTLGERCEIGPEVYLESGCEIGDDVVLRDAVVLRGARVSDGSRISGKVVSPALIPAARDAAGF